MTKILPDCMMPDGADPCLGYQQIVAERDQLLKAVDTAIDQICDVTTQRLQDEYAHGNIMGRIAVALFGDQNNRTDEECVAKAAEIGYGLTGARMRAERAEADRDALRALLAEYPVGGPMSADQAEWLRKVREALRRKVREALREGTK